MNSAALHEAIIAAGMTPPREFTEGRWLRFPGIGKKRSNRSGWCRIISPTLAIFGDWSSNFRSVWKDDSHVDSAEERRRLLDAQRREQEFARAQRARHQEAAREAQELLGRCQVATHPYLVSKGLSDWHGMVSPDGELIVAARAVEDYRTLLTVQRIAPDGTKRFLRGARARGAIHTLGERNSRRQLLCEGYATGLSLHLAAKELWGSHCVIVTFSANNLLAVAPHFPTALVCADHDVSGVGEQVARETGRLWVMPPEVGTDFNDVYCRAGPIAGRRAVMEMLRGTQ